MKTNLEIINEKYKNTPLTEQVRSELIQKYKNAIVIYQITFLQDKTKFYIGSTLDMGSRLSTHRNDSVNKPNNCKKLYNAIRKHGWHNFSVEIIEVCSHISTLLHKNKERRKSIRAIEQKYFNLFLPHYNINP